MNKLYYTAPSDEVFNEVKEACIKIWNTYDDEYGYATQKINRVKHIENVSDNMMFMIAMFDMDNVLKLADLLDQEASREIKERLLAVDNWVYADLFN